MEIEMSLPDKIYPKSNILIRAKYASSLLETKILEYALSSTDQFVKENGQWKFTFSAGELKTIMGKEKSGAFYTRLKPVVDAMVGHTLGIENPENDSFEYHAIVTSGKYERGILTLYFNPNLPLVDIRSNFSQISRVFIMTLKSVYTIRLHQILKSYCYHPKGSSGVDGQYVVELGLDELKLQVGTVNAEEMEVKKILAKSAHPDYEQAVEKAKDKIYDEWGDFRKRVLIPAINEINEKQDLSKMHVTFEPIRKGVGGKTKGVRFFVTTSNPEEETLSNQEPIKPQPERDAVTAKIYVKLLETVPNTEWTDALSVADACNYDEYIFQSALWVMQGSTTKVEHPINFIIDAARNRYCASRKQVDNLAQQGILPARFKEVPQEDVYEQGELDFDFYVENAKS